MHSSRIYSTFWSDYELLDAGEGKKLERWGSLITIRPEINAYFKPVWTLKKWRELASWEFKEQTHQKGNWNALKPNTPSEWVISFDDLHFKIQLTQFKHLGLFPEQMSNWHFIKNHLNEDKRFLNLFAYTGAASIVARNKGASVYHVDSVKQLINWADENQQLSHLNGIHWVLDDALKFANREAKREKKYDGIILDPPAWGRGAKKEMWKLEDKLEELLATCGQILNKNGFLILNTYSPTISLEKINELAQKHFFNRNIEVKELWMKTQTNKDLFYGNLLRVT